MSASKIASTSCRRFRQLERSERQRNQVSWCPVPLVRWLHQRRPPTVPRAIAPAITRLRIRDGVSCSTGGVPSSWATICGLGGCHHH